ncbi:hypothetical protein Poli38472_006497 [Pythium oligandrum]|uniref:Major Facilitator Superfamily (MFS) n=1 Tax=Pythium oligandrum TaxID=41045 RepID=A0A8K1C5L0_PYTOL|nr:hypothetical protein Poli38472_006497 [Pythium oligandrum]|eukprot:TMW56487.1 hypothetical protein Poli38472_006497 [Pythium oligandrum]
MTVEPAEPSKNTCSKAISGQIVKHWTVPPKHRSDEQNEAEKHLFTIYFFGRYLTLPGVAFSRWYLFFASFIVQFCMGSMYSWSVLNAPIDKHIYNNSNAERAVNAFYIAVGVFGTTTAIMGPWIERHGPRQGVMLGTTAYFIGMVISALGVHYKSIAAVYVGYGVFGGFGMGLCYISPVSALQKWFPDYRGTAAGFAVGGYGAGSVVWGKVYLPAIRAVGLAQMFIMIGGVFAGALYFCAVVLRNPPLDFVVGGLNIHGEAVDEAERSMQRGEKYSVMSAHEYESIVTPSNKDIQDVLEPTTNANAHVKKLTLIQAILTPDFLCMYLMFFANQLFGLIVLSKLSNMCVNIFGKTADQGSDIVSANGVFNCLGRLVFPAITDLLIKFFKVEHAFARKCLYVYALISQIVIIAVLPALINHQNYTGFVTVVFILTASYGGGFGTIPAFLTDMFGAYNIGAMHGLILTAWSIGGVVGGISFNNAYKHAIKIGHTVSEAYIDNFHKILIVICIGAVFIIGVRTDPTDRFAPGYVFKIFGRRVVNIKPKNKSGDKNDLLLPSPV